MSDDHPPAPATQYVPPVDNTFGWAIVAVPIVTMLLAVILSGVGAGSVIATLVIVALNTTFALNDRKRVVAAGYRGTSPFWGFLFMPVYVVARGRQTGDWAIPLAYGFTLLLYIAAVIVVSS